MARKTVEIEDDKQTTRRRGVTGGETIVSPYGGRKAPEGPGDLEPEFSQGGRHADLPGDRDVRALADADWRYNLKRTYAKDREAIGIPKSLDGTPWQKSNKE